MSQNGSDRPSSPVLPAIRTNDQLIVPQCPFCGSRHVHGAIGPQVGAGDGLRASHCAAGGYILQEVVGRVYWVVAA